METIEYTICPPSSLPKNKRKIKTKALVYSVFSVLTFTGCCESPTVCETDVHNFDLPINSLLEQTNVSASERESHTERDHMLTRLSNFLENLDSENWDEYGAYPIELKSYENAVLIVKNTPEKVLKLWHVFPSPNGTISFEFKAREIAAMSVGNTDFSFVARRKDDRKAIKNKMAFDLNAATDALIDMSRHLGYYGVKEEV